MAFFASLKRFLLEDRLAQMFRRKALKRRRPHARPYLEMLEDRSLPATTLNAVVQADFFGTRDTSSQPRSLRGLALSGDDLHIYGGFIQGTTSAAIREVSAS